MSAIVFVTASSSAVHRIVSDLTVPDQPSSRGPEVKFLFNFLMDLRANLLFHVLAVLWRAGQGSFHVALQSRRRQATRNYRRAR